MKRSQYLNLFKWHNKDQQYNSVGTLIYDPKFRNGYVSFVYNDDYLASGNPRLSPIEISSKEDKIELMLNEQEHGRLPPAFQDFLPGPYSDRLLVELDDKWHTLNPFEKLHTISQHYTEFDTFHISSGQFPENEISLVDLKDLSDLKKVINDYEHNEGQHPFYSKYRTALFNIHSDVPRVRFFNPEDQQNYIIELSPTPITQNEINSILELTNLAGINTRSYKLFKIGNDNHLAYRDYNHDRLVNENNKSFIFKTPSMGMNRLLQTRLQSHVLPGESINYKNIIPAISPYIGEKGKSELLRLAYFEFLSNSTDNHLSKIQLTQDDKGSWSMAPISLPEFNQNSAVRFNTPLDDTLISRSMFKEELSNKNVLIHRFAQAFELPFEDVKAITIQVDKALSQWESIQSKYNLSEPSNNNLPNNTFGPKL